jgi:hypothetical protein
MKHSIFMSFLMVNMLQITARDIHSETFHQLTLRMLVDQMEKGVEIKMMTF